jgi:hypothetical protein
MLVPRSFFVDAIDGDVYMLLPIFTVDFEVAHVYIVLV